MAGVSATRNTSHDFFIRRHRGKHGRVRRVKPFLIRWLVTFVAVAIASGIVPGISGGWQSIALAALLLGFLNAFVRPVLLLLSLPWIVVTLGVFVLVLNAFLLKVVSWVVPGFEVAGFWSAFFGGIIVSLVSLPFSCFFRASDGRMRLITYHPTLVVERPIKQADARTIE